MGKLRIHELSKELGIDNKELIAFLESQGIEAKNHMSAVEDDAVIKVRNHFSVKIDINKNISAVSDKNTTTSEVKKNSESKTGEAKTKTSDSKAKTPDSDLNLVETQAKDSNNEKGKPKAEVSSQPEKTDKETSSEANKPQETPKKKNIIRVIRPQNSQQGMNNKGRNNRDQQNRRPGGNRQDNERQSNDRQGNDRQGNGRYKQDKPPVERPQIRFENNRPARRPSSVISEGVEDIKSAKERIARSRQAMQSSKPHAKEDAENVTSSSVNEVINENVAAETPINTTVSQNDVKTNNKPVSTERKEAKNEGKKHFNNNRSDEKSEARKDFSRNDGQSFTKNENKFDSRSSKRGDSHSDNKGDKDYSDNRKDSHNSGKNDFRKKGEGEGSQKPVNKDNTQKRKSHKDIKNYDMDGEERTNTTKKAGAFTKPVKAIKAKIEEEAIKLITVPATITIQDLADKMKLQPSAIVKKLFMKGQIVTINQEIEYETAEDIAMEFDVLCEPEKVVDLVEEMLKEEAENDEELISRPPVVCVMGHVDHGKTSLLDAIRHTHVIDREAGGITQHIGAYVVNINGQSITFLDTPGHEAFTAMRMRGASSTDIAILVVAADDGVMPQTIEAINHAKAAGVEIIVAINKIDKPGANIERVKQELTEYELIAEDWGGNTVFCPVSAKTGEGIDNLLEMIILTSEVMELKANPKRTARGLVLEAQLDKGKGPVATVLVQKGTLHVGDPVAAGIAYGKVRAMMDDKGRRVKEAGPSTPVEILGLNDVPGAGDVFIAPETDKEARSFAETYINQNKVHMLSENKSKVKMSLDDLYAQIQEGNLKELDIIVKADVMGSVEAVRQSLEKLSNEEVIVKVIHGGVGAINESDVMLASASNAIIIGFNVRPDAQAKDNAEHEGVDIRLYRVIYNAIEDIEAAMKGMLDPEFKEQVIGHADIRQTFKASGVGTIGGAYVTDGRFDRSAQVRLIRDSIVIYEGSLASLRRFKDDVKEVKSGYECGFVFENYNDIKEGDQVEAFMMVEVPR